MSCMGKLVLSGLGYFAFGGAESLGEFQSVIGFEQEANASSISREWIGAMLKYGEPGICHLKSPVYHWRDVGWGSNMNRERKCNASSRSRRSLYATLSAESNEIMCSGKL